MKLALASLVLVQLVSGSPAEQVLFTEDFESGVDRWAIHGADGIAVKDTGDPTHGTAMVLRPNGDVHAIIRGSAAWQGVRLDGEALFPTDGESYLGFIYNFQQRGERMDFGNIYLKGNGNYLQVNPHRDYNVGRTLYPELSVDLAGDDRVRPGEWFRFRVEVIGRECHVYVSDLDRPQVTFTHLELDDGAFGFQPRSVGEPVWIDNLRVTAIGQFAHREGPVPPIVYEPAELLTDWEVLGPLAQTADDEARGKSDGPWRPFATDGRGAVVTGRVVDFHGARSVAYFRTRIRADAARAAILHLSTIDDLAIWVNGRFHWFLSRGERAWPDFWRVREHAGQRIPLDLTTGENSIVIRVRGGVYATGGFFARLEDPDAASGRP